MAPLIFQKLVLLTSALLTLASCGDEPVMSVKAGELVGTWECHKMSERMQDMLGKGSSVGPLILKDTGNYTASNFPDKRLSRLVEAHGTWELEKPEVTPSGKCSVHLNGDGTFLSIWRRGQKLVLRYPGDVVHNHTVEYMKKE